MSDLPCVSGSSDRQLRCVGGERAAGERHREVGRGMDQAEAGRGSTRAVEVVDSQAFAGVAEQSRGEARWVEVVRDLGGLGEGGAGRGATAQESVTAWRGYRGRKAAQHT
jgi:hypothetical protein